MFFQDLLMDTFSPTLVSFISSTSRPSSGLIPSVGSNDRKRFDAFARGIGKTRVLSSFPTPKQILILQWPRNSVDNLTTPPSTLGSNARKGTRSLKQSHPQRFIHRQSLWNAS